MHDDLAAHVLTHTHTNTHTGEFAGVDVPRRLMSAHLLCVTGCVCVYVCMCVRVCVRMTSLCIGTGPDRISLGPVLSVLRGEGGGHSELCLN